MDSIGAAVVQRSPIPKVSSTLRKKQEACNQWNEGLCLLDGSQCLQLYAHITYDDRMSTLLWNSCKTKTPTVNQ